MDRLTEKVSSEQRPKGDEGFRQADDRHRATQAEETASGNIIKWKCSRFEGCLRTNKETNVTKAK